MESSAMELWATGFNAWNQLDFNGTGTAEPDDLFRLTRVLDGNKIGRPHSSLTSTLVYLDGKPILAPAKCSHCLDGNPSHNDQITWAAPSGFLLDVPTACEHLGIESEKSLAGQCRAAQLLRGGSSSFPIYQDDWAIVDTGPRLVAYEAGFVLLSSDGTVLTAGDKRFPACLGREASDTQPPDRLCPLDALQDLPGGRVVRVGAGGYQLGALTESGDLYCWGGGPGSQPSFPDLSDLPEAVEPPDEQDIRDFAIGESHIIVLTSNEKVYVRGSGVNGQLGLGREQTTAAEWELVGIDVSPGHHVAAVAAGPRSSFVLTRRQDGPDQMPIRR